MPMKIKFYSKSVTSSDIELLEEATGIPNQEQADALLRIYRETRGRVHPDRTYNYIITQPIDTTDTTLAGVSKVYTSLISDLLSGYVTAKMEHVPEKRTRSDNSATYSRLILQPQHDTRTTDTNGYWDENPYYLTCFCFDFKMTDMVTTETKKVSPVVDPVIDAKVKLTNSAIVKKGLQCADYKKKPKGITWKPEK